jgi:hypothetical protein
VSRPSQAESWKKFGITAVRMLAAANHKCELTVSD